MPEGKGEMPKVEGENRPASPEGGQKVEKPVSDFTFREAFASRQRLTKQKETASGDALAKIEAEIAEVGRRENFLVGEVEQEGGLMGLDQELGWLRDMLEAGQLSPGHLYEASRIIPQLDNLAGVDPSDPHAGVREWYYRMKLGETAESLRKSQQRQAKAQQGRTQTQPSGVRQRQQPSSPTPPVVASPTDAEKEVFGEGEAFSDRWIEGKGIPKTVQYYRSRFGTEEEDDDIDLNNVGSSPGTFKPSELFTTILETGGRDPRSGRMLSYLLEAYPGDSKSKEKFSSALVNGFLAMASLKDGLNSGRIDTLEEALRRGPSPQGIAQWLLFDPETRESLTLILRLQGYKVADERTSDGSTTHKEIQGLNREGVLVAANGAPLPKFSDHENIRADQIREYLKKIREAAGTDPGVVRLAYIIFRVLGHPHENSKFSQELFKKYKFTGKEDKEYPNRDLAPEDIASFIDNFKDPQEPMIDSKTGKPIIDPETKQPKNKTLRQILAEKGVEGLAISLNRLPAEKIVREWRNYQLMLDFMDQISDLRAGRGGGSATTVSERQKAIVSQKEFNIALAKRILSPDSISRITDSSKIAFARGMNEAEKGGWREFFADLGFAPKQRKGK